MNIKSHFTFSNQQRNGIFLLLLLIIIIQLFIHFGSEYVFKTEVVSTQNNKELIAFINQIDSLKQVEVENRKPKIYPFNPNFITDYKGYTLGMSQDEINRLLEFRKQDQWINTTTQFQKVTKVSDSLLNQISPYFKFPDWVTNPKPKKYTQNFSAKAKEKTSAQKIDLNKATASQLQKVYGVGEALSARIIKCRTKINGFYDLVELTEVYGLSTEVIENIKLDFEVKTPRKINKISLNKATRDQLVTIKYIDYEVAYNIIEQRTLLDGFSSLEDLKKVKGFPLKKFDIIKLSLQLN
ncbi:DNA uptake protein ComE-like DNA-binding protein [Mesoflavibacter sabulilitoris]|uniref:Competence protein ComEA n=1 Tax=Mesoflavibacter zeaxanthinifaciens subsp. sabulilitoris TaxID=1520893 RepID=A0A2T1NBU0_9FLAO|nr:helix-hairpin-helix domain-containing protein [Mesoflavibacter zeaxanthinifaciens]MBB3124989.1 DNA uptake protein ComE-like DNA-binding protein [Mesoflavibacter zeaxanthinifaciens subsp. sabulilitoris]PSG89887.1 competence protein ComEA [Mesoflavibacter zeaxanthinifaciens subsp. sabulilitoris]